MHLNRRYRLFALLFCLALMFPAFARAAYVTIRPGAQGQQVITLQQALTLLGYPVVADGKYGPNTLGAVTAFQNRQSLTPDGIAGNRTLSQLYSLAPQFAPAVISEPLPTASPVPITPPSQSSGIAYVRTGNVGGLYLRSAATTSDPRNILTSLPNGTAVEVLSKGAYWSRVRSGTLEGYVMSKFLASDAGTPNVPSAAPDGTASPAPAGPGAGTATVQTPNRGSLRLRSNAASSANNVLLSIPYAGTVLVLSRGAQWSQVRYGTQDGYVVSSFLQFADGQPVPVNTQTPEPTAAPAPQVSPSPLPQDASIFPRTLQAGDKGDDVSLLQSRLAKLLYAVVETGSYDDSTVSAVRSFQINNALTADGIFGAESARTLMSSSVQPGNSTKPSYRVLRVGDKDTPSDLAVSAMQAALLGLNYKLTVDGSFGNKTHDAVVAFQMQNDLVVSGIADALTQLRLFSGSAKAAPAVPVIVDISSAKTGGPSAGQVKLLDWYTQVKPSSRGGQIVQVHDPRTGINFNLQFYSLGSHADSEPKTLRDTQLMNAAFGEASWTVRPVYVKMGDGTWTLATMHNNPHLYGSIKDNGFGGHLCVHFKRELEETQKSDPNYGMQNQLAIRKAWENLTGQVVQ
jgi:peptidoglycan hydrolase-like protein with peptidoglycan-binding domain